MYHAERSLGGAVIQNSARQVTQRLIKPLLDRKYRQANRELHYSRCVFGNCLNNISELRNALTEPTGIFSNVPIYSCPKATLKIKVGMRGYLHGTEVAFKKKNR